MIKLLICWAWGHVYTYKVYERVCGERYKNQVNRHLICPNCGKNLTNKL